MINKTSFVENCETSAWGRALGNLGIGIDDSIASAEEVDMAIKKQEVEQNLNLKCEKCGKVLTDKVAKFSKSKYEKELCYDCQNIEKNLPIEEKEI
jgi:ssDNA-binding Zn-finger/Zn-ribbon topoisomerase 1